ncbi:hypothetical protein DQG13_06755 [Paenibacillus sp. YN15]|nr:hypothetical protein DQG13_06755 [Paenibacillus sp. YN15]
MDENKGSSMFVQRKRTAESGSEHSAGAPAAEESEMKRINTNEALAGQFPQWDLVPPVQLVRRRSARFK